MYWLFSFTSTFRDENSDSDDSCLRQTNGKHSLKKLLPSSRFARCHLPLRGRLLRYDKRDLLCQWLPSQGKLSAFADGCGDAAFACPLFCCIFQGLDQPSADTEGRLSVPVVERKRLGFLFTGVPDQAALVRERAMPLINRYIYACAGRVWSFC